MAGKHAAPSTGAKRPLIVILIIAAVAALVTVGVVFFMNRQKEPKKQTSAPTAPPQTFTTNDTPTVTPTEAPGTTLPEVTTAATEPVFTTEAPAGTEEVPQISEEIQIPTGGGEITYFNATYIPDKHAVDLSTGQTVNLREVFGQSAYSGAITFNDDGTFVSNLDGSGSDVGQYIVEGDSITATYTYDRNLDITVTEWDESTHTPVSFYIIVGDEETGIKVLFSGN